MGDCVEKLRKRPTHSDVAQHEFVKAAERGIKLQMAVIYSSDISAPRPVIGRRGVFQHYRDITAVPKLQGERQLVAGADIQSLIDRVGLGLSKRGRIPSRGFYSHLRTDAVIDAREKEGKANLVGCDSRFAIRASSRRPSLALSRSKSGLTGRTASNSIQNFRSQKTESPLILKNAPGDRFNRSPLLDRARQCGSPSGL